MNDALEAFDLSGKTAVLTGASSDMGAAIAEVLCAAGARLVLADVAEAGMLATSARLERAGHDVICRTVDVTRPDEVESLVQLAVARFGRLDVMANIAGVIHDALVVDTSERDLDRVLDVNLKGIYFCCQSAVRVMSAGDSGSIINMASSGGFGAIPKLSAYAMSKAGVVALTRVLAAEVGRHGIRVNAIAPGFVEGGMTTRHARREDGTLDDEKLEETRARARRHAPLRTTGTPRDIANATLFLASEASRYITGQVIHANGGSYMP